MGGCRKRKSSEIIESGRKRFSNRYGNSTYNLEDNARQGEGHSYKKGGGYLYQSSTDAEKTDYGPSVHFNRKCEELRVRKKNDVYNSRAYLNKSIVRSDCQPYNCHSQSNVSDETYVNQLQFYEKRSVNFNELRRYLTDINVSFDTKWNFSTAYDLVCELEKSLKYYIDIRNEIIFLRKVRRHHYVPLSYNEITLLNRTAFYDRIVFLEDESMYRSHRMNQLYLYLQSMVAPYVVDDIRYSHSLSYETCWTDRASHWFNKFKRIRWEKENQRRNDNYQRSQTRLYYHLHIHEKHGTSEGSNFSVNMKSEAVIVPPAGQYCGKSNRDQALKMESKQTTAKLECNTETKEIESGVQQETNIIKNLLSDAGNIIDECDQSSLIEVNSNQQNVDGEAKQANVDEESLDKNGEETGVISNSLMLIEPHISIITIDDEEDVILIEPQISVITIVDDEDE